MSHDLSHPSSIKLSICITTLNRAAFIGTTIESVLPQLTSECEVVVLDGASTDDTDRVVSEYARQSNNLRYVRQDKNNGIDRDYDRTVQLARGEYCWFMTDDDVLKPDAVLTVLQALRRNWSLVIVNAEIRDFALANVLQERWLAFDADRVYEPGEMDRLFVDIGGALNIHYFVVRRDIWLARAKEAYWGSLLLYMGVIFQASLPGGALMIAKPLLSYRRGNAHSFSLLWGKSIFDIWPSVAQTLAVSESTRRKVPNTQPWRHVKELLLLRGRGWYSISDYRRWIRPRMDSVREALKPIVVALIPGAVINALLISYYKVTGHSYGLSRSALLLQELRESRFYFRNWPFLRRAV